jgi:hypothetical protein
MQYELEPVRQLIDEDRSTRECIGGYDFPMRITRHVVVLDAVEVSVESAFWAAMFNGNVFDDDREFHCVLDESGRFVIGVQHAPHHKAPDWPLETIQQQIHLDLHIDNPHAAHEKAVLLGARLVQPAESLEVDRGHQVYVDPAGHPFCLGWGHPSQDELAEFVAKKFGTASK